MCQRKRRKTPFTANSDNFELWHSCNVCVILQKHLDYRVDCILMNYSVDSIYRQTLLRVLQAIIKDAKLSRAAMSPGLTTGKLRDKKLKGSSITIMT